MSLCSAQEHEREKVGPNCTQKWHMAAAQQFYNTINYKIREESSIRSEKQNFVIFQQISINNRAW